MAVTNDWGKGVGVKGVESGGAGVAPVISGVPTISSENQVGETITAAPASVTGTPTPTTTWQWQRSSDGVTGWADISGATSSTYTLVVADDTKYVRVVQTATNASGSDSANSAASSHLIGYDADAVAYFTAASITDTTEKNAVNQLVLDLKGTGSTPNSTDLWTDAAAFYPISPTSLAASAYNLRDTTTLNMTWANSPTHASSGVTFNGTTQYGDTGFNPSTASLANSYDLTIGLQMSNASATAIGLMSAAVSTASRTQMLLVSGSIYQDIHNTTGGRLVTSTSGTYQGRMISVADRTANGGKANYLNGTSLGTKSSQNDGTPVNLTLWTGAQNDGGGGANFTALELRFALIIPKGINATAVADLDDAIVRYSTALSRNI